MFKARASFEWNHGVINTVLPIWPIVVNAGFVDGSDNRKNFLESVVAFVSTSGQSIVVNKVHIACDLFKSITCDAVCDRRVVKGRILCPVVSHFGKLVDAHQNHEPKVGLYLFNTGLPLWSVTAGLLGGILSCIAICFLGYCRQQLISKN